jgi:hypothetical protein
LLELSSHLRARFAVLLVIFLVFTIQLGILLTPRSKLFKSGLVVIYLRLETLHVLLIVSESLLLFNLLQLEFILLLCSVELWFELSLEAFLVLFDCGDTKLVELVDSVDDLVLKLFDDALLVLDEADVLGFARNLHLVPGDESTAARVTQLVAH